MNNKIEKEIINGDYFSAYEFLESCHYNYTIDNLERDFKKVNNMKMYCYLTYALTRRETPQLHLAICDLLVYDPFFCYIYPMVYWHVNRILEIAPDFIEIKAWVLAIYYQNPNSPFTNEEIYRFAQAVTKEEPNNEIALKIISNMSGH